MSLFKCEGLRSFPTKNITVTEDQVFDMLRPGSSNYIFFSPIKIISIGIRDFNDKISFYGLNQSL